MGAGRNKRRLASPAEPRSSKKGFPKQKAPHNIRVLQGWVTAYAKETGQAERRVRRAVSFMLVALVLERARTSGGEPRFLVKGGVSLELRLRLRARMTNDLDAVFRGNFDEWLTALDDTLAEEIKGFTFARDEPELIKETKTFRVNILIDYKGKRWARVKLEVAPEEAPEVLDVDRVEPFDIGQFGLPRPRDVAVVGLPYLIAQKLHACTEAREAGEENRRVHDLMDLLHARDLLRARGLNRVRQACEAIFRGRNVHPWPPTITIYPSWPAAFSRLAEEEDFPVGDVNQAAREVQAFVAEIADA